MMTPPPQESSGMDGSICKTCGKAIKDHSPKEFMDCKDKDGKEWGK